MNLTIFIPIQSNRISFLKRSLQFYEDCNFGGSILIVGLLGESHILDTFRDLDITHIDYSEMGICRLNSSIINYVNTDYICFCDDSGFQIPHALKSCVEFLDKNNEYVGAHGIRTEFSFDQNKKELKEIILIRGQCLDMEDPIFRFRGYMESEDSSKYHVIRKSVWDKMYKFGLSLPNINYLTNEILPYSIYHIMGKVKKFENLFQYCSEINDTLSHHYSDTGTFVIDNINTPDWGECVIKLKCVIINLLLNKGIDKEIAKSTFEEEFNFRTLINYHNQFSRKHEDSFFKHVRMCQEYSDQCNKNQNYLLVENSFNKVIQSLVPYIENSYLI